MEEDIMFEWTMAGLVCFLIIGVIIRFLYKKDTPKENIGKIEQTVVAKSDENIRPEIIEMCQVKYWDYMQNIVGTPIVQFKNDQFLNVVFVLSGYWFACKNFRSFATDAEIKYITDFAEKTYKDVYFQKLKNGLENVSIN